MHRASWELDEMRLRNLGITECLSRLLPNHTHGEDGRIIGLNEGTFPPGRFPGEGTAR